MHMSARWIAIAGAILDAAGVAKGAFGAHWLEAYLVKLGYAADVEKRMEWFDTAVRYQLYHALGMLVVAALAGRVASGWATAAAVALLLGIALFCGSLFIMTFAGEAWRKLGMVAPAGGLAFIVGWLLVAISAARRQ
jgi:uncharacterized membrane protein YgdD (TMEM256/DUF423 family)